MGPGSTDVLIDAIRPGKEGGTVQSSATTARKFYGIDCESIE